MGGLATILGPVICLHKTRPTEVSKVQGFFRVFGSGGDGYARAAKDAAGIDRSIVRWQFTKDKLFVNMKESCPYKAAEIFRRPSFMSGYERLNRALQ